MATSEQLREAADLVAADLRHVIHPHNLPHDRGRVVMARGDGCRVWDAEDREYLDCTGGGLWANLVGHGRREIGDAARQQMDQLAFFCTFWEFTNEPSIRLAERIASLTPDGLDRVIFTGGGSEGIETALKMARLYHHRRGDTTRTWVLSRRSSFHGAGYGGSAATDFAFLREGMGLQPPDFHHLTAPHPFARSLFGDADPLEFLIDELETSIDHIGAENIAAFIGEPIMGVAGFFVPPEHYWTRVAEVLRRHGILLVFDEVVTGFGRTGQWFAAQHYDVDPDIMITAKGLTSGYFPLGAVITTDAVADAVTDGDHGFPVGFTCTGHPTGAAVALANIDIIARERLVERAPRVGTWLRDGLTDLSDLSVVGEARVVGAAGALELVDIEHRGFDAVEPIGELIRQRTGVLVRPTGTSLVMSPPLVISQLQIEQLVDALRDVLSTI